MRFGPCPVNEAENGLLVHSIKTTSRTLKKGHVITKADIADLQASGFSSVMVAFLEPGEVGENPAAFSLATAVAGEYLAVNDAFTGRCNLHARNPGLLMVHQHEIDRVNLVHESLTVATLAPFSVVMPGQLVATIKCIPFAVSEKCLQACLEAANDGSPLIDIAPFQEQSIGFIQTRLGAMKENILDKTSEVLERRLERLGCHVLSEERCEHTEKEVSEAITSMAEKGVDIIVVACASATVDRRDVIPAGIERAGGTLLHFGMPVDPGNLLLLADYRNTPVLGMPGCARSIKFNGFDMVLERLAARVPVTAEAIMRMGVGGLLKEIVSRPLPRSTREDDLVIRGSTVRHISAVVLAAGSSTRMGQANKLLLEIDGCPMVEHVIRAVSKSRITDLIVVTGYQEDQVRAALGAYDIRFVSNPAYADGLSTSLVTGLAGLGKDVSAALVCLGDMPRVTTEQINRLIDTFDPEGGCEICVPVYQGKRGNPVLWSSRFFSEMARVQGDMGARHLISEYDDVVCEVTMPDPGVLIDFDTLQAVAAAVPGQHTDATGKI